MNSDPDDSASLLAGQRAPLGFSSLAGIADTTTFAIYQPASGPEATPQTRSDSDGGFQHTLKTQGAASAGNGRNATTAVEPAIVTTALDLRPLLVEMASAHSRSACIETICRGLSSLLRSQTVRCATGSKKLSRFYDARLGWLGPESGLQRELAARWDVLTGERSESCHVDSQIMIRLCATGDASQGLIWITEQQDGDKLMIDLESWAPALAAVLWSRPAIAIPKVMINLGKRRWWLAATALMLAVLLLLPVRYRVACSVRVEALSPRTLSAPYEAIIEEVLVHPGAKVTSGQTLVKLDGRPLRLERQSLEAEIQQVAKRKDVAMATGRVADSQQAHFRYQQLMRQRDLIDRRLEQLAVLSPIDGIVVSGDLRRSVGAQLEIGRVLMEVAPLNRVLVQIEIPEYELSMIHSHSPVRLRIDASRTPTMDYELVEIYPAGELRDDQIVFVAPLEIDNAQGVFRPGMTGKATVYGQYRPLLWPYMRSLLDQVTWLCGM